MALAVVFVPLLVAAYISPGKPTGYVNDFAGMLQSDEKQALESKLQDFTVRTGNEIAIVTVPSLGGATVENFATKLFEEWQIGKKDQDNGVLVLIARDDRKIRIEVGYGLEPVLTDAQSHWIIQNQLTPAFREQKYYAGLNSALDIIFEAVSGSSTIPASPPAVNIGFDWILIIFFAFVWLAAILGRSKSWWLGGILGGIGGLIFGVMRASLMLGFISAAILIPLGLLFDFVVSRAYNKHKISGTIPPWWAGGGWGGGSGGSGGGGGFGGFGGGGSGGGGASGGW